MTAIGRKRTSWFMNSEEKQKQIKNVFIVLTFLIIGSSAYHVHLLLNRDEQLIEKEVVRSYKACNANICYQELYFEDGEPPKKIKVIAEDPKLEPIRMGYIIIVGRKEPLDFNFVGIKLKTGRTHSYRFHSVKIYESR